MSLVYSFDVSGVVIVNLRTMVFSVSHKVVGVSLFMYSCDINI